MNWDVFISHASEDKVAVAEPLAHDLVSRGLRVWYDEFEFKIGDRLLKKIDKGLRESRFGIVILSQAFFEKQWPRAELDGLLQRESAGRDLILPIWHKVTAEEVREYSPILAGRYAGNTAVGISALGAQLHAAISDAQQDPAAATSGVSDTLLSDSQPRGASPRILVSIDYHDLVIKSGFHQYSLILQVALNQPPKINDMRLELLWPTEIRIAEVRGLEAGRVVGGFSTDHQQYFLQLNEPLYPGSMSRLVGPGGASELVYEFDHDVYIAMRRLHPRVKWTLYLPDAMPVKGDRSLEELSKY